MQKLKANSILQKSLAILLAILLFTQSSGFLAIFAEEGTDSTVTTETSAEDPSQVLSPAAISVHGLSTTPAPAKLKNVIISVAPKGALEQVLNDGQTIPEAISQDSLLKIRYEFDSPVGLASNLAAWKTFELPLSSTGGLNIADLEAKNPHPDKEHDYFTYNFDATAKKIIVTFDETKLPAQGSECFIEVAANFSLNQSATNNDHQFFFPFTGIDPKNFTLRFLPKVSENLTKDGKFVSTDFPALTHDQLLTNPHEILWTVDVNKQLKAVPKANAVIEDTFDASQLDYREGSLKVRILNVALNGTTTLGGLLTELTDYTLDATVPGKLKINFKDTYFENISEADYLTTAYRLEYITNIKPEVAGNKIKINNTIAFDNSTASKELEITQKVVDKAKKGATYYVQYTPYKYWLRWTVDINFAQQKFVSFEDILDPKVRLIPLGNNPANKKLEVYKIKSESLHKADFNSGDFEKIDNWETIFNLNTGADEDRVVLTPDFPTRDAYRIVFDTEIRSGQMPPFSNQAKYTVNTPVPNTTAPAPEKEVPSNSLNIGPIASSVSKALDEVFGQELSDRGYHIDYHKNEIRWRINIEPKTSVMTNLKIEDYYPNKGLTYVANSLSVKKGATPLTANTNGNPLNPAPGSDYTFIDKGEDGFDITFHTPITEVVQILYKTKFDRNKHSKPSEPRDYYNYLKYYWQENPSGSSSPKEAKPKPFIAQPYIPDNGGKNSSSVNADRTIDWVIYANHNGETINNLVVNDTIAAGHELVEDSIKVKEYAKNQKTGDPDNLATVISNPDVPATEYSISNKTENGFTVTFLNTNGKLYAIVYKTKLTNNGLSQNKYLNTATLDGKPVQKEVDFPNYNNFVFKNGAQARGNRGWYVDWTVNINKSLSYIPNVVITDSLSEGQEYDPASVNLYLAKDPTAELPNSNNELYTVAYSPIDPATKKQSMTITFNKPIELEYLLKYSTILPAKAVSEVDNTIKISGENVTPVSQEIKKKVAVAAVSTTAGSRPHSAFGSIKITKTDQDGNRLKDMEFELWKDDKKLLDFTKTNEHGESVINGLVPGSYVIKEKAHADYVKADDVNFDIPQYPTVPQDLDIAKSIKNYRKGSIILTKVDKHNPGKKLSGAVFELWSKYTTGAPSSLVTAFPATDANGKTTLNRLNHGSYIIKEITAPDGYLQLLPSEGIEVVISKDNIDVTKTIENIRKGSITITKIEKGSNKPIQDIEFELVAGDGMKVDFPKTDANGKAKLEDLAVGTYVLKEKLSGKYLPIADQTVEINEHTLNLNLQIENTLRDPLPPYVPDTDKPKEDPKPETPKPETPGPETPKPETPKPETPGPETPGPETPKPETPKPDTPGPETPKPETPKPRIPITTVDVPIVVVMEIPDGDVPQAGRDPKHGKITFDGKSYTYTPNKGFSGKDDFSVVVTRPDGSTYEEEIEIEVEIPQGVGTLPKTDGFPPVLVFLLGSMLVVCGFMFKRKY